MITAHRATTRSPLSAHLHPSFTQEKRNLLMAEIDKQNILNALDYTQFTAILSHDLRGSCESVKSWQSADKTARINELTQSLAQLFAHTQSQTKKQEILKPTADLMSTPLYKGIDHMLGIQKKIQAQYQTSPESRPQVTKRSHLSAEEATKRAGLRKEGQYRVKAGDTLSEIAHRHGTSVKALMEANPQVKDANKIRAGDALNLPAKNAGFGAKPTQPVVKTQEIKVAQVQTHAKESAQKPTSLAHDKVKGRTLMAACDAVFAKDGYGFQRSLSDLKSDSAIQIIDASHLDVDRIGSALVRLTFDDGTSYEVYLIAGVEPRASGSVETVLDLYDYGKALYANKAQAALTNGLRNVGETLDGLSGGDITSDPDYIAFDKSKAIDYAFKTRPQIHIERIRQLQAKHGIKDKLIVAGFSGGGLEGQLLRAMAPELVSQVYAYDSPGVEPVIDIITNGNDIAKREIYKDIHIVNFDPNHVNQRGSHPEYVQRSHIACPTHSLRKGVEVFDQNGISDKKPGK